MTFEYILGGTLAGLAIAYLLYVLLWPERFQGLAEIGMMEIVVAAVAAGLEDRRSTHGEALIRSACEMLAQTSPGLVAAVTVSLPAAGPAQTNWLRAAACSLAAQYELDAGVAAEESHVSVRLTRRQNRGGRR